MKKKLSLLTALALFLTLSSCAKTAKPAPGSPDDAPVPLRVAFCTWVGYAPLFIAENQGYFAEYGYEPEIIIMEDESAYGSALVSNSIDALGQVLDRDIIQYAAGAPEQYVCTMDASTGGDGLVATAEIQTVDDLAGKTVALDKSATSYFFFLQLLADSNITESDIQIVEMGNDEAGEAFIAGSVDAAVTWEPQLSNCSLRKGGHILVSSADYPKAIIDVLTVNSNFLTAHPGAAQDLLEIWNRSIDYLNENPDEGYKIMAEGLDLDVAEVQDSCNGVTYYDRKMNANFIKDSTDFNVMEVAGTAAAFWLERGYIDNTDLSGFFAATPK